MEQTLPKLKTNLDTNLLKLVAVVCMLLDHFGGTFFEQVPAFRWAGRLAFPLFCYCMTVGMLYTHDIKRYLGRLGLFALISQPFWILAFNAEDFWGNLLNLNIFFTLFMSLLTVWGFKEKKYWLFVAGILVMSFINFDYSTTGIILMIDQSRLSGFTTFISSCSIQSFFYNTYIMIIKHRQCTSDVRKYRFVGIFCCMNSGKRFKERFCHKRIIFLITIWP